MSNNNYIQRKGFIELTDAVTNETVLVNARRILTVYPTDPLGCMINMEGTSLCVLESYPVIRRLINRSCGIEEGLTS